ncbi:MAG TPA: hypothetical protein DEB46_06000 [Myxococcales bacterium]|nr:hypothetical protein [Myxococcales bacterium]
MNKVFALPLFFILACAGPVGPEGPAGSDGSPCASVTNSDGSYTITCPDSDPVTIRDGEAGAVGADGQSCSAQDNGDGSYTIVCPGSDPVTVRDGADGEPGATGADGRSCRAEDHGDGSYTISCPDSDPITVRNGENGASGQRGEDGDDGDDGADGDDCNAEDNGDGTLTIRCGDQEPVVVRLPRCGDGVVAGGEECDDGNARNTDVCTNTCRNARCGDGVQRTDIAEGDLGFEACDDGNEIDTDLCLTNCAVARCGDNVVYEAVEECDDANEIQTDACLNDCSAAACGDNFVQENVEDCDDANDVQTDACLNDCSAASCGDNFVHENVEECDDANEFQTDACLNDCRLASCGDSFVHEQVEECDDGNDDLTDACLNDCTDAECGDGHVQVDAEACDDANDVQADACLGDCTDAECGDGIVRLDLIEGEEGFEACDDGDQNDANECTNDCTVVADGSSPERAATSCQALLEAYPDAIDEHYFIDPDGFGGEDAVELFCDMTTDGGGWAIIFRQSQPNLNDTNLDYTVPASWLRSTAHEVLIAHRFEGATIRGAFATFQMPQEWVDGSPYRHVNSVVQVAGSINGNPHMPTEIVFGRDSWEESPCLINGAFGSNGNPNGPAGKICLNVSDAPGHSHWARAYHDRCGVSQRVGSNDEPNCEGWGFTIAVRALPSPLGSREDNPATSCQALGDAGQPSGFYYLEGGNEPTFRAFCDLETNGGGWTRSIVINQGDTLWNPWTTRRPNGADGERALPLSTLSDDPDGLDLEYLFRVDGGDYYQRTFRSVHRLAWNHQHVGSFAQSGFEYSPGFGAPWVRCDHPLNHHNGNYHWVISHYPENDNVPLCASQINGYSFTIYGNNNRAISLNGLGDPPNGARGNGRDENWSRLEIFVRKYVAEECPEAPESPCLNDEGHHECYDGRIYWFCPSQTGWEQARDQCREQGMELVSVESQWENDYVHAEALSLENAGNRNHLWMSLNRRDGQGWQWLSESAYDWTNWAPNGPRENEVDRQCAYLIGDNDDPCCPDGTWFRELCEDRNYAFACESQ